MAVLADLVKMFWKSSHLHSITGGSKNEINQHDSQEF